MIITKAMEEVVNGMIRDCLGHDRAEWDSRETPPHAFIYVYGPTDEVWFQIPRDLVPAGETVSAVFLGVGSIKAVDRAQMITHPNPER
jgi:hypothetical protein